MEYPKLFNPEVISNSTAEFKDTSLTVAKSFTFPHMLLLISIIVFTIFYISKLFKKTYKSSVLVVFLETLLERVYVVQSKKTNIAD